MQGASALTVGAVELGISTLTGVFAIATLVAAAVSGLIWGNLKTVRDSNADLRLRVSDLEAGRAEDKAKIGALAQENAVLARHVTGEAHWEALHDVLDEHNKLASAHWGEELSLLRQIAERLPPA